jgi:hypothetical protein
MTAAFRSAWLVWRRARREHVSFGVALERTIADLSEAVGR